MYELAERTRAQFEEELRMSGIWALYTRTDRRFFCRTCYDLDRRAAKPDCPDCFGTGYKTVLQPWLVQWTNTLRRPQEIDPNISKAGPTSENVAFVISRAQDAPVTGDRVFIVEWNEQWEDIPPRSARPTRMVEALQVFNVDVYAVREVIYYISHCTYASEQLNAYQRSMLRAPLARASV